MLDVGALGLLSEATSQCRPSVNDDVDSNDGFHDVEWNEDRRPVPSDGAINSEAQGD